MTQPKRAVFVGNRHFSVQIRAKPGAPPYAGGKVAVKWEEGRVVPGRDHPQGGVVAAGTEGPQVTALGIRSWGSGAGQEGKCEQMKGSSGKCEGRCDEKLTWPGRQPGWAASGRVSPSQPKSLPRAGAEHLAWPEAQAAPAEGRPTPQSSCKMQGASCKMQDRMHLARCKMQGARCTLQDAGCVMHLARSKIASCKILDARYILQDAQCRTYVT